MPSWEQVKAAVQECHDPRRHKERLMGFLKQNGWALRFADYGWCCDRDVVLSAVKSYGMALEFSSPELCEDKEVVEKAIKNNGMAYMYAGPKLKEDRDLAIRAVRQYGPVIEFCCTRLRRDHTVALTAVAGGGSSLMFCRELREDKAFCLEALKVNTLCLGYIEPDLRQDPDILKTYAKASKAQRKERTAHDGLRRRANDPLNRLTRSFSTPASARFPALT